MGSPRLVIPTSTAGNGENYVVGYETDPHQLHFANVSAGAASAPWSLGCATASVYAQGWYSPEGTIVVFSTSRPFNGCGLDLYTDGPPTRLQIVRLGDGADPFYPIQARARAGPDVACVSRLRRRRRLDRVSDRRRRDAGPIPGSRSTAGQADERHRQRNPADIAVRGGVVRKPRDAGLVLVSGLRHSALRMLRFLRSTRRFSSTAPSISSRTGHHRGSFRS
jgi:hypothetical protein